MKILINGLYRSGNNWSRDIIKHNISTCHVQVEHFFSPNLTNFFNAINFHIMIYKNPYNWVNSIIKQCWDMPFYYDLEPTDECYKIDVTIGYPLENIKEIPFESSKTISLEKLIRCYNNYFYHWTNKATTLGKPYIFIQYENILKNPEKFVDYICNRTSLKRNENFINPNSVNNSRDWSEERKKLYLKDICIDESLIRVINKNIDSDIMKLLGFQYLN